METVKKSTAEELIWNQFSNPLRRRGLMPIEVILSHSMTPLPVWAVIIDTMPVWFNYADLFWCFHIYLLQLFITSYQRDSYWSQNKIFDSIFRIQRSRNAYISKLLIQSYCRNLSNWRLWNIKLIMVLPGKITIKCEIMAYT